MPRPPSVSTVTMVQEGAQLVYLLRRGPRPQRSLEVAYELYRRFPNDFVANQTLVACVFDPSASPLQIDRPKAVGDNTAALVGRVNEEPRWIYVEDAEGPVDARGEKPKSSEFVRAMWGKQGGESFEYAGHQYRVVGVENKVLRRVHEIMERFEENFPDRPVMQRFTAPTNPPEEAPLREKLGDMYDQLEKLERHSKRVETLYREQRIPIASFAALRQRAVFEVVQHLALDPALGVRADDSDAYEWFKAVQLLLPAKAVVIDGTVLASASVLGLLDALPKLGLRILVPRTVVEEIRELSLTAANPRRGGSIALHEGRVIMHEPSPEEIAAEVAMLEKVLKFVNDSAHCEIVSGDASLDIPAEDRQSLQKNIGTSSTDAVAIAWKRGLPLWTDDFGLQDVLGPMGVRRVWTQAVLRAAVEADRLARAEYVRALGTMLHRGYSFLHVTSLDIAEVLESVDYRVDSGAGAATVRFIRGCIDLHPLNPNAVAAVLRTVMDKGAKNFEAKRCILAIVDGAEVREFEGWKQGLAELLYRGKRLPVMAEQGARPLKHFLRSWRSHDGEFKPGQVRAL